MKTIDQEQFAADLWALIHGNPARAQALGVFSFNLAELVNHHDLSAGPEFERVLTQLIEPAFQMARLKALKSTGLNLSARPGFKRALNLESTP